MINFVEIFVNRVPEDKESHYGLFVDTEADGQRAQFG